MAATIDNVLFIARKDFVYMLRDRFTLVWLLLMPPLFFYFIGSATGGFGGGGGKADDVAVLIPDDAGFVADQLVRRVADAGFNVVTFGADNPAKAKSGSESDTGFDDYCRQLTLPAGLTATVRSGEAAEVDFSTCADELSKNFDEVRIQRAVYTTLADIIAAAADGGSLEYESLERLNAMNRALTLSVGPAGKKREIPVGFQQAVPGTMVLFTMLILLTSGAISLMLERKKGVLRRLASAPISRAEIVAGKWLGKMSLALCQLIVAMLYGSLLFKVQWQPDLPMIATLLLAWAGVCTSLGLLLGSVGNTEGQIVGSGVLSSMLLAGLGGCWWPIEIAPPWMQNLAGLLPTGWTMNGLHKLMSFEAGPASVLPELGLLTIAAVLIAAMAVRRFRYV